MSDAELNRFRNEIREDLKSEFKYIRESLDTIKEDVSSIKQWKTDKTQDWEECKKTLNDHTTRIVTIETRETTGWGAVKFMWGAAVSIAIIAVAIIAL